MIQRSVAIALAALSFIGVPATSLSHASGDEPSPWSSVTDASMKDTRTSKRGTNKVDRPKDDNKSKMNSATWASIICSVIFGLAVIAVLAARHYGRLDRNFVIRVVVISVLFMVVTVIICTMTPSSSKLRSPTESKALIPPKKASHPGKHHVKPPAEVSFSSEQDGKLIFSRLPQVEEALRSASRSIDNSDIALTGLISGMMQIFGVEGIDEKVVGLGNMMSQIPASSTQLFYTETLPKMIQHLLERLPTLEPVPYLISGTSNSVTMTADECYILIAASFFCIPLVLDGVLRRKQTFENFFSVTRRDRRESQIQKLRCMIEYFNEVTLNGPETREITISRHVEARRGQEFWEQSTELLSNLWVHGSHELIETNRNYLQADFANKSLGGGVLGGGCVQEEIRFMVSPELLVSTLICEPMRDNEVVLMEGSRQYSTYTGYASSFKYAGKNSSRGVSTVLAIDAIDYSKPGTGDQFSSHHLVRELEKVRIGLNSEEKGIPFATGNWGCGAFKGDLQLKFILQWLAASVTGRRMEYYPLNGRYNSLKDFREVIRAARRNNWTVGTVFKAILRKRKDMDLFTYLLTAIGT